MADPHERSSPIFGTLDHGHQIDEHGRERRPTPGGFVAQPTTCQSTGSRFAACWAAEHHSRHNAYVGAEVHAFVNDLERPIGTYLYGRRMYETMVFWDHAGIWRAADKIVYSRALEEVSSARTRIEREFDWFRNCVVHLHYRVTV
jgi:hypothetical protein